MQNGSMHIGVNTAGTHLPSAPHVYALHHPFLQSEAQSAPIGLQLFDIAARRLAASDGAVDIANANAATAPAIRNFVVNFVIVKSSPFLRSPNI
jgi:hypothetical protein